ncbi:hypothetical protein BH09BAC5_BH09BAC5_23830 [soil metagenome]
MPIHIGKLIEKRIRFLGISKSELGRRMKVSPQQIQYHLGKKSIDTEVLLKISNKLDYDFFQHYLGLQNNRKAYNQLINASSYQLSTALIEIKEEINTIKLHNTYLREILNLLSPLKQTKDTKHLNY